MAMTKKEQEEVRELKRRLSTLAALRWTEEVLPDVPIPAWSADDKLSVGYLPCYSRVEKACSSSLHHAIGRQDKTTSQQARSLYSTKLLALKALRYEKELRFAGELADLDIQIAAEKGLSE